MDTSLVKDHPVLVFTVIAIFCATYFVLSTIFPPLNFPRNIPTIPFYVSLLPLIYDIDQEEIYDKYLREKLEKYGAVKIYFASQWNILVTKPQYLQQIFKYEDIFSKSGNQKKAPHSLLSQYTGDNVISAHGDSWKLYRKIITQSIQFPNTAPVVTNTKKLVRLIKRELQKNDLLVVSDFIQRFCLANIGDSMLGVDLQALDSKESSIHQRINYVKRHIFHPFYLSFPFFDSLPIPSRLKARLIVKEFRKDYCDIVQLSEEKDSAGYKLTEALKKQHIDNKQFADNAIIIMVAGHENPQLLLTSLLYVLAKYPEYQNKLRQALKLLDASGIAELQILNAIVYETLRMYPPLGQIINRCTTAPVVLGKDIFIPRGVYVGYNNFGTGRDPEVWGPDSQSFQPERWGRSYEEISKEFSAAKWSCRLPAFHGRKRACIGEKFALFEVKVALAEIISNFDLSLAPEWQDKLTPAGPIGPRMLKLKMKNLNQ